MDKPQFSGGIQTGYNLGQNGEGWPPFDDALSNHNRGGFYIRQLRVKAVLPFDSTFQGVFVANALFAEVQEAYLQKRWGAYLLTLGKFRGAGLRSGNGIDEFERVTVRQPFYANLWAYYKKSQGFRDLGVQGERSFFDGTLQCKLFFHNANGENVLNNEPSVPAGAATQALGLDYEMDYRVSKYTLVGGSIGALGDREWAEFLGTHKPWEVGYWFKTNPVVDFTAFHQMDFPRFHLTNEAMLLLNRRILTPPDSTAQKTWGVSSQARFDVSPRWSPFCRYEFTDPTDGTVPQDDLHLITVGTVFRPSPVAYPALGLTAEYVRGMEEGLENRYGNDIFYAQLQMMF